MRYPSAIMPLLLAAAVLCGCSGGTSFGPPGAPVLEFDKSFDTNSAAVGPLSGPVGIALNGTDLWVVDRGNDRLVVIDTTNAVTPRAIGQFGHDPLEFDAPTDAIIANSNVYVADTGNRRVQRLTTDGQFVGEFGVGGTGPGEFVEPTYMASGSDVMVVDSSRADVQVFDANNVLERSFGGYGTAPGQMQRPRGIAKGTAGVWVADGGLSRLHLFSSSGVFARSVGFPGTRLGSLDDPEGLLASGGSIYVVDSGNARVQVFNESGTPISAFGTRGSGDGEFIDPSDIASGSSGTIYVSDTGNNRIQRLSPP